MGKAAAWACTKRIRRGASRDIADSAEVFAGKKPGRWLEEALNLPALSQADSS